MSLKKIMFFHRNGYFENPQYLQVEITDFCPLKCEQCYKKDADFTYLGIEQFKTIVREAVELGVEDIFINGGEPLAHKDFWEMISYCDQMNVNSTVFTSGVGIEVAPVEYLKKSKLKIHISLNGSSKAVNQKSRDGYEYAIRALDHLMQNNICYGINWVARHDNLYDLYNLIEISHKYCASYINIVCNKMTGKGKIESPLRKEDYIYLKKVVEENPEFFTVQSCYGILLSFLGAPSNKLYGCQAGIRLMAVTAEGKFMPCTHLHYIEAFDNIKDYWIESKILKLLRETDELKYCNECQKCRVCHSISKEAHDDLRVGFKDCPMAR